MLDNGTFRLSACAAAVVIVVPLMATTVAAQRGHGHGGGGISSMGGMGGAGRMGGMSGMGGMGGVGGMSRAAPMGHSAPSMRPVSGFQSMPSVRSLSGSRSLPTTVKSGTGSARYMTGAGGVTSKSGIRGSSRNASIMTARGGQTSQQNKISQINRNQLNSNHLNSNQVTKNVQGVGRAKAIQNTAFASASTHNAANRALSQSTFKGHFADRNWGFKHGGWWWWHRNPIIVIGWIGPLFWPYAYWDFVDYVFWPYAYDVFWPYVYDDLYVGIFGPYSYEGAAYSAGPAYSAAPQPRRVRAAVSANATATDVVVCSERAAALTEWPIQKIMQAVEPNDTQQAALNELKNAAAKAVDVLQSGCPTVLLSTPIGRVAAMHTRLETMLQAVSIVQPPLQQFYESLSDEQKARFDAVAPESQAGRATRGGKQPPDLSKACSEQLVSANMPINRIEQAVRPTDSQRTALSAVHDATLKAAEFLKAHCSEEQALTPPGRVAAMEQRLGAMLEAIKIVQPPLEVFYRSLTNEQKARFNQLGSRQIARS
jgi:hypothetical protein